MEPVFASKFISKLSPEQRAQSIAAGIIPVNDALYRLHETTSDIWLLRGGRGGGKSEAVYDRLLNNALRDKFFNCYYGRKVLDKVRKSCFENIYECIEKLNLQKEFIYSKADNSSMTIRCRRNGNKFQPFGGDKPDNLKSFKDPSHIVCEEFDQFAFADFQDILPSMRTPKARCEFFGMFNTKDVMPGHWLLKVFFPELYDGDDRSAFDALEGVQVEHLFVNFCDNYFIDQRDYLRRLKLASGGNHILLNSIAYGAWGVIENGNPWLYAFRDLHEKCPHLRKLPFMASEPIYLTFDINADPLSCTAWQRSRLVAGEGSFLHAIKEFGGKIKVDDICAHIMTTFPNSIFYVTGDRSGQNQDVGRNQTIYQMIQSYMGLSNKQMNLNTANLEHQDSRLLCNTIFEHYPIYIDPEGCPNLVADMRKATVDMDSTKGNQLLKDRGEFKMDYFDGMRYLFQTYYLQYIRDTYLKLLPPK